MSSAQRRIALAGRAAEIVRFAAWIVANGGEIRAQSDVAILYRSAAGDGSLSLSGDEEAYTGDARMAWSCCKLGSTLSPFALHPVEPPRVVQSLRARAAHTVTIIADASLCPDTGAAGWAAWMIADGMPSATRGAPLDGRMADSGEAELFALAGALQAARRLDYVVRGAEVLLQSDSLWALSAIRAAIPTVKDRKHATAGCAVGPLRKNAVSGRAKIALTNIVGFVDRLSLTVAVRHVPGHGRGLARSPQGHIVFGPGSGRQVVNCLCDAEAKRHMRTARILLATNPPVQP